MVPVEEAEKAATRSRTCINRSLGAWRVDDSVRSPAKTSKVHGWQN